MAGVKTKIILLNGASNSGKNSIAKSLQEIMDEPYLHIGIEHFMKMMPREYLYENKKSKEGFYLKKVKDKNENNTFITGAGSYGKKIVTGMMYACLALAQKGINLIIEDVCYGVEQFQVYKNLFARYDFFTVGVYCSLKELLKRESDTWMIKNKIAKQESKFLHRGILYDLVVDTSKDTSTECAKKIRSTILNAQHNFPSM